MNTGQFGDAEESTSDKNIVLQMDDETTMHNTYEQRASFKENVN